MKSYIIVDKEIYHKYKEEILPLNARLFTDEYFYNLEGYNVPLDLKGIENYLNFIDEIEIFSMSSFIDFINILLVLSFLLNNSFKGNIVISYYLTSKNNLNDALFTKVELKQNENRTKTESKRNWPNGEMAISRRCAANFSGFGKDERGRRWCRQIDRARADFPASAEGISGAHCIFLQCTLDFPPVPTGFSCGAHWIFLRCPPHDPPPPIATSRGKGDIYATDQPDVSPSALQDVRSTEGGDTS